MHIARGAVATSENVAWKGGEKPKSQNVENGVVEQFLSGLSLQESVHVVNLDNGTVSGAGGCGKIGTSIWRSQPYKHLPSLPMQTLKKKLDDELQRAGMSGGLDDGGLMDYDSAFEFAPTPETHEKKTDAGVVEDKMSADVIRDAFLVFMADVMGDYTRYIIPPSLKNAKNSIYASDLSNYLDVEKLLNGAESEDQAGGGRKQFLKELSGTQMFSVLVQQRTESSSNDSRLVFFEQAVNLCNSIKAQINDKPDREGQEMSTASLTAQVRDRQAQSDPWGGLVVIII